MQRLYELRRDEIPRVSAWYTRNDQYFPHFHSTIELAYVLEGTVNIAQDGIHASAHEGMLIVNSCYMLHGYETPENSLILFCTIPLNAVPFLKTELGQKRFRTGIINAEKIPQCRTILQLIAEGSQTESSRYLSGLAEALLDLLITHIGLTEHISDAHSDLLRSIVRYIQDHAGEALNVSDVAAHFGYSTGRFTHLFTELIGCSFTKYLSGLRCRMAQPLLTRGDMSISEIASECGFGSLRSFHRIYRDFTGHTPGAERKAAPANKQSPANTTLPAEPASDRITVSTRKEMFP